MLINIRNKENRSTPLSSKEVYNTIMDIKLKQVSLSPIFFYNLIISFKYLEKNEVIEKFEIYYNRKNIFKSIAISKIRLRSCFLKGCIEFIF